MKRMQKILSILIVLTLILTLAACGSQTEQQPMDSVTQSPDNADINDKNNLSTPNSEGTQTESQTGFTVVDSRGIEVSFEKVPGKIVSLMPSNTEILYALNCGENIVGVSDYCNYPEDTNNKQKFPTGEMLNVEAIIALDADVVILGNMSAMVDQINQIEQAGANVIITEANSLSETYEIIEMIGNVVGKKAEAQSIVSDMKSGFESIRAQVEGNTSATIYVEVSPLEYGLWSCGKNTFIHELIEIVGAKNIFEDVEGWSAVSEEQVLTRNPDVIITTASPLTGIEDPVGDIKSRVNWSQIGAVKSNKVVMIEGDMVTRPGPRLLDGAKELVKLIN